MCGIFGIINPDGVSPETYRHLGELNSLRGNLSYGGVVSDGQTERVFRLPTPFDADRVPLHNCAMILSHLRAPTGARTGNPAEIHPFETATAWLAHNGLLLNYRDFPQWRLNPTIDVDSQVLLGGIQAHLARGLSIVPSLQATIEKFDGQQACWLWHKPERALYLWRVMSPIYVGESAEQVIFSSKRMAGTPRLLDEGQIYRVDPATLQIETVGEFSFYSPYKRRE